MQSSALTPDQYTAELPDDRKAVIQKLRTIVTNNIPPGFEEVMGYGMLGYVVPHSLYPQGYHCNSKDPLPFFGMASQKNTINIYHMGIYADQKLYDWFVAEFSKHCKSKLDMGKSCIRFKKLDDIPYDLIGELVTKMTVEEWIELYETSFKRK
jgi:uncharacterized protein YdhG (YjbR/CyaY superfamily)